VSGRWEAQRRGRGGKIQMGAKTIEIGTHSNTKKKKKKSGL